MMMKSPDVSTAALTDLGADLYKTLYKIRRAEELIIAHYPEDQMKTPMHMSMGQEAIPAGVCQALDAQDQIFASYRSHAAFLAKSGDTDRFFAELYGKRSGTAQGKAGSMHLADPARGHMLSSAIVTSAIPVALGAAFAHKQKGNGRVACVFFGDGALDEGAFWESLNVACLMKLPVLFVCEDNGLAIHTPAVERRGFRSLEDVVRGFKCHVAGGDGSDLPGVVTATRQMLRLMSGKPQPGLLHFTYLRFLEHVGPGEDFDAGYRRRPTADELERVDPVLRLQKELRQSGCSEQELEAVKIAVDDQINRSVSHARQAPFPSPSELYTDVLA